MNRTLRTLTPVSKWLGGLLVLAVAAGCGGGTGGSQGASPIPSAGATNPGNSSAPSGQPTVRPSPVPTATPDAIQTTVNSMSLDEKLGQMVLVGVDGLAMDAKAKDLIAAHHVGGIILYKPNIASASQTVKLLNDLKAANRGAKAPLLLSVDQEGGKVSRMPDEYVKLPAGSAVGKTNNADYARQIGAMLGEEVKSVGFNMNFAPVLDINSNPNNPVIGERSLGADAALVGRLGVAEMKGLQETNVVPVVKHFPGHGDTGVDSHLDLPVVNKSLDELRELELKPFREAVRAGTDAVMIAHILLPKLDKNNPASFSQAVIRTVLREELGFQGVVITDDMTMGAVIGHYDLGLAAVQSVKAGSDIILVAHEYDKAVAVLKSLKQAAADGVLTKEAIDSSVYRILALKQKYGLADKPSPQPDVERVNTKVRGILENKGK